MLNNLIKITLIMLFSIFLTGCADGDVKIKAIKDGNPKKLILEVDTKPKGTTKNEFVTFKMTKGEHLITVYEYDELLEANKVYERHINIESNKVLKVLFNLNEEETRIEVSENRENRINILYMKMPLEGEWIYTPKSLYDHEKEYLLEFDDEGNWKIDETDELNGNLLITKDKLTLIGKEDKIKHLLMVFNVNTKNMKGINKIDFDIPKMYNGCFNLKLYKKDNKIKMCEN